VPAQLRKRPAGTCFIRRSLDALSEALTATTALISDLTRRITYDNLSVVQLTGSVIAEPALNLTFAALADPTRRAILDRLAVGEATVAELASPFSISQQAISKHLKVLEQAGLISRGRTRQARPCRLVPGQLDVAVDWIEHHRRLWAERYDRLDAHLADLRQAEHNEHAEQNEQNDTERQTHDH
jgi:DNA-binding transcriptional ArsR family regulator